MLMKNKKQTSDIPELSAVHSEANDELPQPSEDRSVVNAAGKKRSNDEVLAVAPADDDSPGDVVAVVPKKPKERAKHWVEYFLQKVPFQARKLSGRAQKVVERMDEFPEQMYQCLVADHYVGTGQDHEFLTPFQTMLSEGLVEQEVVASHFIRTPRCKFEKLCKELAVLQKELEKKLKTKKTGNFAN